MFLSPSEWTDLRKSNIYELFQSRNNKKNLENGLNVCYKRTYICDCREDLLVDCFGFYAVSAILQSCTGGDYKVNERFRNLKFPPAEEIQ